MKIENITNKNIKRLPDVELRNLKIRFINIYDNYFASPGVAKAVGLIRDIFYEKYVILRIEMKKRKIKLYEGVALDLDKEINNLILQKLNLGIDVSSLSEITILKSYVAISGAFIESPKTANIIDIVVRNVEKNRDEGLEKKITMVIKAHTGKTPNFIYSPSGPDSPYIPVFDLMLISREDTKKIKMTKKGVSGGEEFDINKPYPNEHACRLREPNEFKDKPWGRTKRISDGKRYSIITGRLKGETTSTEQAYRYPKDIWTEAQAKAHCKDHDGILFEPAKEVKKEDIAIEKPEETENTIRIPVAPECEVTATITIDKEQGITALYCGRIKKIRTYQFDKRVKAWTMASAQAWVKEHKEKVEKQILGKLEKKLSEVQQKEYDEESALIRENAKKAKYPHKFEPAKFTHPNGHPRCIHCGDEELVDAENKSIPCEKPVAKFTITKIDKAKQMVGGVVYEPDEVDTQGDYTDAKEIEKAMYRFMEKYATDTKRIRINHQGKKLFFPIVESFIPEHDTMKGDHLVKAGSWWLMIKITNDKIWEEIEDGTLKGFSMGGRAKA